MNAPMNTNPSSAITNAIGIHSGASTQSQDQLITPQSLSVINTSNNRLVNVDVDVDVELLIVLVCVSRATRRHRPQSPPVRQRSRG